MNSYPRLTVGDRISRMTLAGHHCVQKGSGVHLASYTMGTRGSFPEGNAAGAWSWPLKSIKCRGSECVDLYLHSPNTSSQCGDELSTGTTLPLPFYLCVWVCPLS